MTNQANMLSAFVTVVCFAKGTNYLGLATTFDEFTRSGATIGKKSNQIKSSFKLDNARSGYPVSRARGSCIMPSSIPGRIGLLQLAITWYKIRHVLGQANYYSRTGTSKQRQVKLHWFRTLCFNVPLRE